jgi:phosphatidylglycerol:prolipoprotein diacylglycerol transferase
MRQVLFTLPILGGIKLFGYGLMLFLAFMSATRLAAWLARREKLEPEVIHDGSLVVLLGGLVGARLFYVIQYWGVRIHDVLDAFRIWEGGIVLYGSIIGGAFGVLVYRRLRPFRFLPFLDAIAPSLALGIAVGRFGCFLNGCCYGDVCELPWAVSFPAPSPPWEAHRAAHLIGTDDLWSLPVHPTQLYSVLDGFVLVVLLVAYFPLRRRDGEVMALLMVSYPITRFLIEHLRGDEGVFAAGMTMSQCISILLLGGGGVFWHWLARRPCGRFADDVEVAYLDEGAVA